MLTREENELLVRVGPGTPMGQLMRLYWVPAALSSELTEPDCPPVRVKILGEKLVAFRDSEGRVGLLNEFCAHRGASLFLGRNEDGGLRCVYHGWKYDVAGNCVDMLNEPQGSTLKTKICLKAYPTVEMGGVVWAYLGPPDKTPPLPRFEWTQVPETHQFVMKSWEECNWLQSMEGGMDPVHASILHAVIDPDSPRGGTRGILANLVPKVVYDVDVTDYGLMWGTTRTLEDKRQWVRVNQFVMPFHTFWPFELTALELGGDVTREEYKPFINGHMFVPMDDENTMTYNWTAKWGEEPLTDAEIAAIEGGRGRGPGELTREFKKVLRNKENDWLIDRKIQKTETFTGIEGMHTQDHAVQESMGPIIDRTQEHLGTTDKTIILARKMLLGAVRSVQEDREPPGIRPTYYRVRAVEQIMTDASRWREALKHRYNAAAAGVTS